MNSDDFGAASEKLADELIEQLKTTHPVIVSGACLAVAAHAIVKTFSADTRRVFLALQKSVDILQLFAALYVATWGKDGRESSH